MPKKKAPPVTPNPEFKEKLDAIINRAFGGEHHVREVIWIRPTAARIKIFETSLSTFDFNNLTVLVIMAHDVCARVAVSSERGGKLSLLISNRTRTTNNKLSGAALCECHPDLDRHEKAIRYDSSSAYQDMYREMLEDEDS